MRERERKKERKKEGGRENCSSLWRKRAPRARACGTPAARQNEHGGGGAHVLRVHFCKALLVRELRRAREGLVDKEPQQLGLCPGRLRAQLHRAETLALGALKQRLDRRRAERRLLRLHLLRFRRSASRRPSTPRAALPLACCTGSRPPAAVSRSPAFEPAHEPVVKS